MPGNKCGGKMQGAKVMLRRHLSVTRTTGSPQRHFFSRNRLVVLSLGTMIPEHAG